MQNNFCEFEELVFFDLWNPDSGFRFLVSASTFWIPDSGFRFPVPDSSFRSPGFRVAPICADVSYFVARFERGEGGRMFLLFLCCVPVHKTRYKRLNNIQQLNKGS